MFREIVTGASDQHTVILRPPGEDSQTLFLHLGRLSARRAPEDADNKDPDAPSRGTPDLPIGLAAFLPSGVGISAPLSLAREMSALEVGIGAQEAGNG